MLSTDDDPANLQLIASVAWYSTYNQWIKYATQRSAPIALVAGQRYALRTRVREGAGGDHIRVAWDPPGPTGRVILRNNELADVNGVRGQITYRRWNNLGETQLRSVNWERPATNETTVPTGTIPAGACTRCASELSGWLIPPVTGLYELFVASDEEGALWLSPDEDPANLVQIGHVPTATQQNQWNRFPEQASGLIQLEAGQPYAIRARVRERWGADHLSIGWRRPGENTIEILPSEALAPALEVHTSTGDGIEGLHCPSGTWESPPIDTGAPGSSIYGLLSWQSTLPDDTLVTAQIATANSPDGPWDYRGPDGTTNTSYELPNTPVGHFHDGDQFIRVKLTLTTTDPHHTPAFHMMTVEHTPTEIYNEITVDPEGPVGTDQWLLRIKPGPSSASVHLAHRGPSDLTSLQNTALKLDASPHVSISNGTVTQERGDATTIDATRTHSVALTTDTTLTPATLRATWIEQPTNASVLLEHDLTITIG